MKSTNLARVLLWMSGALISFTIMALSVRGLANALTIFEILTLRTLGALVIMFALAAWQPHLRKEMRPQQMGLNILRNTVHFGSLYAWALSITLLPLATVFSLEFTMPVWLSIIAVFMLGERLTTGRIAVVVLGFAGALLILRPGFAAFQTAALLPLAAAIGYATFNALTKKMSASQTPFALVFWMNMVQFALSFAASGPFFFSKLDMTHLPAVIGISVSTLTAHYCLTSAFRAGDAMLVLPIDFLRVPLIAIIGWLLFGESLDIFVLLGGAVMLIGIVWNLRDEAKRAQKLPEPARANIPA